MLHSSYAIIGTFKTKKHTLTITSLSNGYLTAVIKTGSGTVVSQGFIYPGRYQHLRGLFARYFSSAKVEDIMTAIITYFGV